MMNCYDDVDVDIRNIVVDMMIVLVLWLLLLGLDLFDCLGDYIRVI